MAGLATTFSDSDAVYDLAVEPDSTVTYDDTFDACDLGGDRAPCNVESSRETLSATGLTDLDTQSTDSTVTYDDTFDACDLGGDRAPCNVESSRETLCATGLTDLDTQSTGFGDAERPVRVNDLMTLLTHVATVTGMKTAYTHSRRGAMLAGGGAFVGGMLGGPFGIAVGGTVGGLIGWITSEDFKSVPQVLKELSAAEKQKLSAEAMAVVKNLDWTDAAQLIKLVMSNSTIRQKVLGVLVSYITNGLNAKLKYGK
ncbi:protein C19orf12 homolog [Anomalospiza imberbis]|uniref:protein C19orf12 homolog n=1 Tax=Anomalospiza imberbis TaxID=187417 RepID=UPI00358FB465